MGYRREIRDMNNAILNETRWDNRCDPRHWENNGFQGHVQSAALWKVDQPRKDAARKLRREAKR